MSSSAPNFVELHGRKYQVPKQTTAVVCVDGFDPEYLEQGIEDGILPNLAKFVKIGFHRPAKCAMPSLTNPNNCSIITGTPTAVHGISGNYYLDRETKKEYMVLDDALLRGSTILAEMANAGVRVAAVTAKDKLRKIINHGLDPTQKPAISFSSQCAGDCNQQQNGIEEVEKWLGQEAPPQYSGDLSLYVLDAGIRLVKENRADLLYLTLSDYIQHKYAPRSGGANDFMKELDTRLGKLAELGAVVAVTGDHGMSDKCTPDGKPNILFLQDDLASRWPDSHPRVICPITDPFVTHHGALGSFVRIFLQGSKDNLADIIKYIETLPQVENVCDGDTGAERYEMPADREGDIVVVAKKNAVIGSRKEEHDLSKLQGFRLRSHGGLSEQEVPVIRSTPVTNTSRPEPKTWRNFDIFDLALNW